MSCFFVFFFKQKTAYEMRISDWSSDVCSSDLACPACCLPPRTRHCTDPGAWGCSICPPIRRIVHESPNLVQRRHPGQGPRRPNSRYGTDLQNRSEEHTSELQSLMRISYAVFCLKKQNDNKVKTPQHNTITRHHKRTTPSHR